MRPTTARLLALLITAVTLPLPLVLWSAPQQTAPPPPVTPGPPPLAPPEPHAVPEATPLPLSASLQERLSALANGDVAARMTSGIKIVDVETGNVVVERNPREAIIPASNMKVFTTAAAFELLPDDFKFVTTVAMRGEVNESGVLEGDLKVTGRGDPTIGGRFHDANANQVFESWAEQLLAQGVRAIGGDLILEYGYFDEEWVHPTWPPHGMIHWYQAPVAALSLQEGTIKVRVTPTQAGQRPSVEFEPRSNFVTLQNTAVTGGGRGAFITRRLGTNNIIVRGNAAGRGTEAFVAIENPVQYFASVLRTTLEGRGIRILGAVRMVRSDDREEWREVIVHSTPVETVNIVINKKSQNQYAEQMVKTLGAELRNDGSFAAGGAAVTEWLTTQLGVPAGELFIADGSGMSRENRASPDTFIRVLRHMWASPHRNDFLASLPYNGEFDSTLRRRLNQPAYAGKVRAKTGYLRGAVGLSGYVRGDSGRIYAFSFLFNSPSVGGAFQLYDEMLREIIVNG
jgi:serine-type D-Ala-D-Ala carboxypeptidase/endopeptidase (penicillin-binding protein 4)